ncbi:MAG: hypothetical protein K8F30_06345, partial [Taibaiella sp.]|nr:hypothetical protein [Taibaiella sp.]
MLFSNIATAQTTTINTQSLATSGYSSATSAGSGGTAFITFCIYNNTGGNIKMTEVGRYVTTAHNGVESTIYYSSTSLSGAVGSLPATGWTQIHKDTIAGVSASAIAKVNDNVNFTIPNGATYRFALLIGGTNYYSSSGSPNSFTVNNISLYAGNYQISGSNVGYGATNTPRYFRGYVTFEPSCAANITTQPKDSTLCAGGNAGFGITATNANTYQWQLSTNGGTSWNNISNGGVYSGATTNTLSITGTTTAMNNYKYRCAATNTAGSCTVPSEAATLIVNAVPAITSTTADTACTGTPAQLAAVATAGATVQWYNQATGGTLLGTGNTLNIPSAPATNTNYYAFPNVTSVLTPDSLSVQMGATNSQTGCFMDIKALANIKLTDISWIPTATQSYDVSIYFKTGTAVGFETTSSSWTQIGSATGVSATAGVPIKTTLSTQPNLSANTTYAILVIRTGSSGSVRYQTVSAVGSVEAQNSDLQLISAKGISGLFTGTLFSPRQLACIVWYQKGVTPPCTATTRTPVQLVVDATPAIISHPKDSTICANSTGAFISAASNASSYQWEVSTDGGTNWNNVSNGSIYSGATTPSLIITGGTVAMNGYKYRCKASCTSSVTSNAATLTIITTPAITTDPLDATICDGGSTNFSCAATGAGQLSYQWQISTDGGTNWTNVIDGGIYSGSATTTLNITGATVSTSGYRFRCSVSGICAPDAMSNEAILTVNSLPAVTTSPASEADCPGTNVTFSCAASGTSVSYQWQE